MQELELTWVRILKVYWLMLWRGLLMVLPAAFVAGATVGALLAIMKLPIVQNHSAMRLIGGIVGYLASIPIYFLVLRMAIRKKYRDFRFAVLPADSPKL